MTVAPGKGDDAVDNLAITKAIFGPESDPGRGREEDYQILLDHLADDFSIKATIPEDTPISVLVEACRA